MSRQYGIPKNPDQQEKGPGYGKDPEPKVKQDDPSPPNMVVSQFHKNASVDVTDTDIHHTLGQNPGQASPGPHRHRGGDSALLLEEFTFTGSKSGNPGAVLATIIPALVALGAKDSTT